MNTRSNAMPGLTLLEVLLACAMLAALGMATVSLLRSLSDADRDRRTLIAAPMVMAAANDAFDQRAASHISQPADASEQDEAPPVPIDPITIEINAAPLRWVVTVTHDRTPAPPSTSAASATNKPAVRTAFAVATLRFEAAPDEANWRGTPIVWHRLLPNWITPTTEQNP